MYAVETYAAVRQFVFADGKSRREAARVFGLSRDTIAKMCRYSMPPGYTRHRPANKPKLGALIPVIEAILETDRTAPVKQRHTAKRIFERLRDEHGFGGGYTVVKDHVRIERLRGRETFVPLAHPPGHAQVDFGEAIGVIGGVRQKIHFFCMDLPQSDACFIKGYPAETTEAFLDGHVSAFAFFDGVPLSILYDNLKIAVANMRGWRGYFGFCETPQVLVNLTRWVRMRLRVALWRQWKTPRRRRAALLALGVSAPLAKNTAASGYGPWRLIRSRGPSAGLSNAYFRSLGLPSLFEAC